MSKKTRPNNNRYLRTHRSGGASRGHNRNFGLGLSFVIVVIAMIFMYFGRKAQVEIETEASGLAKALTMPTRLELGDELTLPTASGDLSLSWSSSNVDVITNEGLITHPSYSAGDATVVLTVRPTVIEESLFLMIFKPKLASSSFTVVVSACEATAEETATRILSRVMLPTKTASSITLPIAFPGTELAVSWTSSDEAIMTSTGVIKGAGEVTLTLALVGGSVSVTKNYAISCVDRLAVTALSLTFDGDAGGKTYTKDWSTSTYTVHQGIIHDEVEEQTEESLEVATRGSLYLKAMASSAGALTVNSAIIKPCELSFSYTILDTHATYTKSTELVIYNGTEVLSKVIFSTTNDERGIVSLDLTALDELDLRIALETAYASMRIKIDDVVVTRDLAQDDIRKALEDAFPDRVREDLILPTTSIYGGILSIATTPAGVIAPNGAVKLTNEEQTITVTLTLTGASESPVAVTKTVTVASTGAGEEIRITFIDLGKYGMSDCGESTIISLGDIDVLVDAGDNIAESKKAIQEALTDEVTDGVIEYVIATHPDSDHIGGMANVYGNFQVDNTILFNGTATSQNYLNFASAYQSEPNSTYHTIADYLNGASGLKATLTLSSSLSLTFFDTGYLSDAAANARSLVFRLDAYGTSVLFTGDADNNGRTLEENYMAMVGNIDILKVVHHGTANGTSSAFLEAVDPECAIICNGNYLGNKYGHPSYQAVNRLYQYDKAMNVYAITGGDSSECLASPLGAYTCSCADRFVDRNGMITITITNQGYNVSSTYGLIEFSETAFWQNNPKRLYQHE